MAIAANNFQRTETQSKKNGKDENPEPNAKEKTIQFYSTQAVLIPWNWEQCQNVCNNNNNNNRHLVASAWALAAFCTFLETEIRLQFGTYTNVPLAAS